VTAPWWCPYEEAHTRGARCRAGFDLGTAFYDALFLDLPADPELLVSLTGKEQR